MYLVTNFWQFTIAARVAMAGGLSADEVIG
jgi:hypothetical protein